MYMDVAICTVYYKLLLGCYLYRYYGNGGGSGSVCYFHRTAFRLSSHCFQFQFQFHFRCRFAFAFCPKCVHNSYSTALGRENAKCSC